MSRSAQVHPMTGWTSSRIGPLRDESQVAGDPAPAAGGEVMPYTACTAN